MKADYIFTLVHFVLVITFRHSGRAFEPESSDLCCWNMSLKVITSLLSNAGALAAGAVHGLVCLEYHSLGTTFYALFSLVWLNIFSLH